jgi:hypothetical protein
MNTQSSQWEAYEALKVVYEEEERRYLATLERTGTDRRENERDGSQGRRSGDRPATGK